MNLADLDLSTTRLILAARMEAKFPSPENRERLIRCTEEFDQIHAEERGRNLIRALWGPGGLLTEDFKEMDNSIEDAALDQYKPQGETEGQG